MHIRPAQPSDLESIAQLHTQSWRTAYRGMLSDAYLDGDLLADRRALWTGRFAQPADNQSIVVAEIEHTIVGLACSFGDHDARWGTLLENLHVAQGFKGSGIGAQLVSHVARWCVHTHRTDRLHLWVLAPNLAAQGFYQRMGASAVEESAWDAPDGNRIAELRFAWPSLASLLQQPQDAAIGPATPAPHTSTRSS